jgi:hypothetical protein
LCEDPALAEAIIEIINNHDGMIGRIERLQEIAILLRDRLRIGRPKPELSSDRHGDDGGER